LTENLVPPLIDKLSAAHTLQKVIDPADYNRIRLALRRIGTPLRLTLENMRCLDVILDDKSWLCIDSCMDDRPILAWTSFQVSQRSALNEPVICELRLYHVHSGLVMGEVMENIGLELQQRLDAL
jgi:hypothetical protein